MTDDRKQRTEDRYPGLKSPCSMHHALCPMPITPQSDTRSQMSEVRRLIFRPQLALLYAPCPMPYARNPVTRTPHPVLACLFS